MMRLSHWQHDSTSRSQGLRLTRHSDAAEPPDPAASVGPRTRDSDGPGLRKENSSIVVTHMLKIYLKIFLTNLKISMVFSCY